jgi:Cft2 family RNA processing exonuclease
MTCNEITADVISTGSKGNAVVLGGMILFDCGIPYKKLESYAHKLRLVLLTHVHGDHFNPATVRRLHQERPTLRFGCGEWMVEHLLAAGVAPANIDILEMGVCYDYCNGDLLVKAFPLIHDVKNCGWKIWLNGKRALYATDTASMEGIEAKACDLYMIEANYTEEDITERIRQKEEAGEFCYEHRAMVNHLSREAADLWLMENAGPESRVIYLHGHEERKE